MITSISMCERSVCIRRTFCKVNLTFISANILLFSCLSIVNESSRIRAYPKFVHMYLAHCSQARLATSRLIIVIFKNIAYLLIKKFF